jgi:hypothetical protein
VAQPITRRGALIRTVGRDTTAAAMLFQSTTQLSPAESNMKVGLAGELGIAIFCAGLRKRAYCLRYLTASQ